MKYIILVILVVCSFSCAMDMSVVDYSFVQDEDLERMFKIPTLSDEQKLGQLKDWIYMEIEYKPRPFYWQTLDEVYDSKVADCKGMSALYAHFVELYMGAWTELRMCILPSGAFHMYCWVPEYDFYFGGPKEDLENCKTMETYTLSQYNYLAENF